MKKTNLLIRGSFMFTWCILIMFNASGQQLLQKRIETLTKNIRPQHLSILTEVEAPVDLSHPKFRSAKYVQVNELQNKQVIEQQPLLIEFSVPTVNGNIDLILQKAEVTASDFIVNGNNPALTKGIQLGVHYRGYVKSTPENLAAVSFFNGEVIGAVYTGEGNLVIGKLENNKTDRTHIIYNEAELPAREFNCAATDSGEKINQIINVAKEQAVVAQSKCVKVYMETDYDVFQNKGSVQNVTNYITALMNQVGVLYTNENIVLKLSEVYVWSSTSPYSGSSSSTYLSQFRSTRTSFNGDVAHLVNLKSNLGGVAYVDVLCNTGNYRYGYSGITSSFSNVPNYSWSVEVVTHELGHNLGSPHTHSCTWPGGAIDNCYTTEGGCAAGPAPTNGGTIMSYCHLTSTGINFNNGFGPLPGGRIRDRVTAATCLGTCETGTVACNAPTNVTTGNISSSGFTINWTATPGSTGYEIQYRVQGTTTWSNTTTSNTTVTLSGLNAGTTYEFQIRSVCGSDLSPYTSIGTATTATASQGVTINMKNGTETSCTGTLYDDGGPSANYAHNKIYTLVIQPSGATSISMNFSQWAAENNYDFLKIYNGTSTAAPLLGSWSGTSPGTVIANSGAMTLRFTSDGSVNAAGWKATWTATGGSCSGPAVVPVADFSVTPTTVNAGATVQFTDLSTNTPTSWSWTFQGGTPATSTVKNPAIVYNTPGTYSVSLTAGNAAGSNTKTKTAYITVLQAPVVINMKNGTETACSGTLYDDGGSSANYTDNKAYTLVIQPSGATSITMNFSQWAVENGYDFLKIYNGTSTSAPLLGSWSGTSPGTVTANSGAMTLRFTSDATVTKTGWKATWTATGGNCTGNMGSSNVAREAKPDNIEEFASGFNIFPNPNSGHFTVQLLGKYDAMVIMNIAGEVIWKNNVQSNNIDVSLEDRAPGIYFVQLIGAEGVKTAKIIVE